MALDGCVVSVTGSIGLSSTGYYSRDMYIDDARIQPDPSCRRVAVPPDPAKARIAPGVRSYNATVKIDLSKMTKPMEGKAWRTDGSTATLNPWQAYVDPQLTGGYVLWVSCREGFRAVKAKAFVDGKYIEAATTSDTWLDDATPGLDPSETGPSSITITCVKNSNQVHPTSSNLMR